MNKSNIYENILNRLHTYRGKVKWLLLLKRLYLFGAMTLMAVLIICVLEAVFMLEIA